MGSIGMGELIIILLIVLVVFGAGKLPQVGDALGGAIRNFRRSSQDVDRPAEQSATSESQAQPTPGKTEVKNL